MHPLNLTESEIRHRVGGELERAVHDRHHEWRTPVLATVTADGFPNARTVVLRQADAKQQSLQIYTDSRSPKAAELVHQPAAVLVFWSARLSWQLRLKVAVQVVSQGPQVDGVWERVGQSPSASDYLSVAAPGDVVPRAPEIIGDSSEHHHLSILLCQIQELDWLELRRAGHRRAVFNTQSWSWRVP